MTMPVIRPTDAGSSLGTSSRLAARGTERVANLSGRDTGSAQKIKIKTRYHGRIVYATASPTNTRGMEAGPRGIGEEDGVFAPSTSGSLKTGVPERLSIC